MQITLGTRFSPCFTAILGLADFATVTAQDLTREVTFQFAAQGRAGRHVAF